MSSNPLDNNLKKILPGLQEPNPDFVEEAFQVCLASVNEKEAKHGRNAGWLALLPLTGSIAAILLLALFPLLQSAESDSGKAGGTETKAAQTTMGLSRFKGIENGKGIIQIRNGNLWENVEVLPKGTLNGHDVIDMKEQYIVLEDRKTGQRLILAAQSLISAEPKTFHGN